MDKNEKVLKKYAETISSDTLPSPRFGHTVNLISKTTIVVFGGAISTPINFTMTADLYLYSIEKNIWKKLEPANNGNVPNARAAHASATVRDNQLLFYGGSVGNGHYAKDELWFLEIKNNEEASWMKVPIEGETPGSRYGHSLIYLVPALVLFGGSIQNEIMSDVWVFATDKTPFKWVKVATKGVSPSARLYHSCCVYTKYNGNDAMILFGGRDKENASLKDLFVLKKEKNDYEWKAVGGAPNEMTPIGRHQQCSIIFGPFLFVVGGRVGSGQQASFDVFSFNKEKWHRFGTIGLFRHSIWIYFNEASLDKIELYLYIYGGFDGENNSQINSSLFRVNIVELFSKNDVLRVELQDYLNTLIKKSPGNKVIHETNKSHFELNNRVVVYTIPEENNNFGSLVKEISYSKLAEVDKKILEKQDNQSKKKDYDEDVVREFIQLIPNPDEEFIPLTMKDQPIILNKDYISKLIANCQKYMAKIGTVIHLRSPIKIFGSINGQYNDLIRYFSLYGRPSELKGDIESMDYLFLGNLCNRGAFSIEVFCLVIALKLKYPSNVHILRGSQDDIEISKAYGLAEECKAKLGENPNDSNSIFRQICELFEYFPLAAVVNNQILCVHSGIGEHVRTVKDITNIKKPCKLFESIEAQEILWSTPNIFPKDDYNAKNLTSTLRQKTFDEGMVKEFLAANQLKMIIRSHDVCESGVEKLFDNQLITLFSATNYCNVAQNVGGILSIKKSYEIQPKILTCVEGFTVWMKDNWNKTECPPSPKRLSKNK